MRDGTKLFTSIYVPKKAGEIYPILLNRTPYGVKPYGTEPSDYKKDLGPNMRLTRDLYIYVYQDVRGKYMSEGEFINMTPHNHVNADGETINESTDTFDTIEWLLENIKNNNGKVGQWGISYPGFYTAAGMIDSHPALVRHLRKRLLQTGFSMIFIIMEHFSFHILSTSSVLLVSQNTVLLKNLFLNLFMAQLMVMSFSKT